MVLPSVKPVSKPKAKAKQHKRPVNVSKHLQAASHAVSGLFFFVEEIVSHVVEHIGLWVVVVIQFATGVVKSELDGFNHIHGQVLRQAANYAFDGRSQYAVFHAHHFDLFF